MFRTTGPFITAIVLLVACQSPPAEPIDEAELAAEVEQRSVDEASVRAALALIDQPDRIPAIALDRLDEADGPDFWLASALAHEPGLRAARRELQVAHAIAISAGLPGPIGLGGRTLDLEDLDRDAELSLSIDILGLFGLGPAAAASALADARIRRASAGLEEALWRARFAVEEARLRLAVQVGLRADLRGLVAEVADGLRRFDVLDRLGRLPPAAVARARANAELLEQGVAEAEAAIVDRRVDLARLAGIPLGHPMLTRLGPATLDRLVAATADPEVDPAALVRRHPELRRRRFDYALAEADLRRAVAEQWPSLRVGPRGKITPDDFITGGLVDLGLPWPGSLTGEIEAALARRARAREVIEEALVDALHRVRGAKEQEAIARRALVADAEPALRHSGTTWHGLQALFAVDEGRWDLWTDALNLRTAAIRGYWRARESAARARLVLARELALPEDEE